MDAVLPPYLEALNSEQRAAVLHKGSHLLILAGAGSGKTRVITTKIAHLIREEGMDPRSILAVTFTNKAAREMAERAMHIEPSSSLAMLRTFHSFGAWFLRRNGSAIGLDSSFVIYDEDDSISLLNSLMDNAPRADVKKVAHNISRAKDYFLGPQDSGLELIDYKPNFRRIYAKYEKRMSEIGNVDFGDLIKKPVEILKTSAEIARRFHERFRVILVDEYQDSNIAQFELLKELTGSGTYVCVVGDDDQSIYRFRGAEVRNILEFPERFPGAGIIRLEQNYRSTAPILKLASQVVDNNEGRLGKKLRSVRGNGSLPALAWLPDQDAECAHCAKLITQSVKKGARYSEWAILYRINSQSVGFETEFLRRGIPYRVVGSLKFYEREEIKDALALLSFMVNSRDEVAFKRVVNKPSRGVGKAAIDRVLQESLGGDLVAASEAALPSLTGKARGGLACFISVIRNARLALGLDNGKNQEKGAASGGLIPEEAAAGETVSEKAAHETTKLQAGKGLSGCVVYLVNSAGIAGYHESDDESGGGQRINNLQELANMASLYDASAKGLLEFLENIELDRAILDNSASKNDADYDAVTLITLHNTKGLEFRRVIITGLEQGVFPWDNDDIEEERRLFYVGATRAMDELYLTSCAMRRRFGRTQQMEPSVFIGEIDRNNLNIQGMASKSGRPQAAMPGFSPAASQSAYYVYGGTSQKQSSDGRWKLGDYVFNDDRGYGAVIGIEEGEDGPEIRVRFETGGEICFNSAFQSSRYMKVER